MNREELYRKFGPKLIEAMTLVIKDEINLLRINAGLSERTNNQIMTALNNKLGLIKDYAWMKVEEI